MSDTPALRRRTLRRKVLLGSIRADEVLPAAVLRARLKWGRHTFTRAVQEGLQTIRYGRCDYVMGSAVLEFFRKQQGQHGDGQHQAADGQQARQQEVSSQ